MRHKLLCLAVAAALAAPAPVWAATGAEVERLRAEFERRLNEQMAQVRQEYEQRLRDLEQRVRATEVAAEGATAKAEAARAAVPAAAAVPSLFNPEISLVLQGRYHHAQGDGHISGFLPAGHAHGAKRGFSLDYSELALAASIDPYFRGFASFAVAEDGIETEEAWVQTTALGHGFTLRAGRHLSGIGYANEQHPHAWDFADQNLPYAALFGTHYIQNGVQARWVAPTPMFLELGAELGQGADWSDKNRLGSRALFARLGGDVGTDHAWRAGLSHLRTEARDRHGDWHDRNDVEVHADFSGQSRYWIADLVWKWAPGGNPKYRNFEFQAEYLRRHEQGELECKEEGLCGGGVSDSHRTRQSGWYAQGVYQFHPQWRAGYRYDRLDLGRIDFGPALLAVLERPDYTPRRHSLMLDYSPSEFSRLRLQLARDHSQKGLSDDQITLQYIHSLGPHGAHRF